MQSCARACSASSRPGAGARLRWRIPSTCMFSTAGQHATAPSAPRTAMIESSRSNATNPSRMSGTRAESAPRGVDVARGAQHGLALPVVAAAPGLQHRGQPELRDRRVEPRPIVDGPVGRGRDPERSQRVLLDEPVLRHLERGRRGQHRHTRLHRAGRLGRYALPLVGDDGRVREPRAARRRCRRARRRRGRPRPQPALRATGRGTDT